MLNWKTTNKCKKQGVAIQETKIRQPPQRVRYWTSEIVYVQIQTDQICQITKVGRNYPTYVVAIKFPVITRKVRKITNTKFDSRGSYNEKNEILHSLETSRDYWKVWGRIIINSTTLDKIYSDDE